MMMPSIEYGMIEGTDIIKSYSSLVESVEKEVSSFSFMSKIRSDGIKMTLVGDAGGSEKSLLTKFGFYFHGFKNNSGCDNIHLLSCFKANDTRNLVYDVVASFKEEIQSLANGIETVDGRKEVEFSMVSDLKFISNVIGHKGCAAKCPCPFCVATKDEVRRGIVAAVRTHEVMKRHGRIVAEAPDGTKDNISKQNYSQFNVPAVPDCVKIVPPVMHIIAGVCHIFIKRAESSVKAVMDDVIDKCNANIQRPAQEYTAKHASKIVQYIVNNQKEEIPDYPIFKHLKIIIGFCGNRQLMRSEIESMSSNIKQMFVLIRQDPSITITPKMHILEMHIIPFVEKEGSWGIYTEQGIEAIHKKMNDAVRRIPDKDGTKALEAFNKEHMLRLYLNRFDN